jgi:hypothetical protein
MLRVKIKLRDIRVFKEAEDVINCVFSTQNGTIFKIIGISRDRRFLNFVYVNKDLVGVRTLHLSHGLENIKKGFYKFLYYDEDKS